MGRTVRELELTISYKEYLQWLEMEQLQPLNTPEIQLAVISSLITAASGKATPPQDFILSRQQEDEKENKPLKGEELDKLIRGMF